MLPGGDPTVIDPGPEDVVVDRAVDIVADILLTGPDHLHRSVDLLGDPGRGVGHVRLQSPAKAAADQMVVHCHLRFREAGRLGHRGAYALQQLGTWLPIHASAGDVGVTCTVQFSGSMQACASSGIS